MGQRTAIDRAVLPRGGRAASAPLLRNGRTWVELSMTQLSTAMPRARKTSWDSSATFQTRQVWSKPPDTGFSALRASTQSTWPTGATASGPAGCSRAGQGDPHLCLVAKKGVHVGAVVRRPQLDGAVKAAAVQLVGAIPADRQPSRRIRSVTWHAAWHGRSPEGEAGDDVLVPRE